MRSIFFMFLLSGALSSYSQRATQVIRGRVLDSETRVPLPGAIVLIPGSEPLRGVSTDAEGFFRMEGIPVGRYSLEARYLGYESVMVFDLQLVSGKESVVELCLKPVAVHTGGVEIKAQGSGYDAVNKMAMLSVRQISMEEAGRYAGGFDDPSRLAATFAGVAGNLSSNGIVIRGNSPRGLLWQLEGVPVSNPNHFSDVTTFGGGGITALSSQMISNSDFFTAAFPAEYGNALSGVFDLRIRQGNHEKTETTVKAGTIGLDLAMEGPFSKGKQSSYLFNYRYSTLALLAPLLPEHGGSVRYQDLCWKTFTRVGIAGTLSFFGLGSTDRSGSLAKEDSSDQHYPEDRQKATSITSVGALGLSYKHILSAASLLTLSVNAAGNMVDYTADWYQENDSYIPAERVNYHTWSLFSATSFNHRFSPSHSMKTGVQFRRIFYRAGLGHAAYNESFVQLVSRSGHADLIQVYAQSKYEPGKLWHLNFGLYFSHFTMNRQSGLEPRAGLCWNLRPGQKLSLAYGLHSQTEMLPVYLVNKSLHGSITQPNRRLPFSAAHHLVLGWDKTLDSHTNLKAEIYHQALFHIPVISGSSFSMINLERDWYLNEAFTPDGKGRNTGIDLTLERHMNKGYYYLFTASLFDSRYRDGNGDWRNTRYNKHWLFNLLGGKEWQTGRSGNNTLGLNARINFMGGDRMTPADQAASQITGDVVYDESRAFTRKKPDVYYVDFTLNFTRNKPAYSSTWSVQLINLLGQKEYAGYRYHLQKQSAEIFAEVTMVPNISWKIAF
ncbi:MAG TPA: TonB-dependent receptor [Bacteroidales bacterium]|nr:TonB-dependent receptor [Bacteroidales bacterium]HSA44632.1 TonB-dependent receptor [Bacteroidales bacterium]